jgi:hypothetical protein
VGRTWHGGLLFQSEDYGQVAAMRFALLPTATVAEGVIWEAQTKGLAFNCCAS